MYNNNYINYSTDTTLTTVTCTVHVNNTSHDSSIIEFLGINQTDCTVPL